MQDIISLTILGVVQGLTEFLPISSTGHLILAREFFGFTAATGLAEDAILHLATALAVLVYFRSDILRLIKSFIEALKTRLWNKDMTLLSALILGTVPAVVAGLYFESAIETVFRSGMVVALGLIVGSLIFILAEWANRRIQEKREITLTGGILVGVFQALALIPGMSRSGMAISGGMLLGLSRVEAARFAFLLSFPIILGAGGFKLFELFEVGSASLGAPLIAGALAAFLSGILAIHVLISFLKTHSLMPFVVYRLLLAVVIIAVTL